MAVNTLEFRTQLSDALDKKLTQSSVAQMLLDDGFRQKFVGAKTVLLPDVDFVGLADYDRDTGFTRGGVTVDQKSYTLSMDRGRTFSIDREDMDEIGISNLAGQIMGEFVRTEVAPEVDAYTLSKIATTASANVKAETATADNVYTQLITCINSALDASGYDADLVAFVNPTVWGYLQTSSQLQRMIRVDDFKRGELSFKVHKLNDCIIKPVQAARMKSSYTFGNDGFTPAGGAVDVQMLVLPRKGASLVKKSEKIRVFEPDQNQAMDAYKFDYRLYYDCLVKNSYKGTIFGTKAAS